ncbi:uncharacterized protein A4U43_C08F15230 [Asparagus officinalis]|nr:uncharacterized protein A4U43_C08F15230 [Asparagus officinalis]
MDRVLATWRWRIAFPSASVLHAVTTSSDHCQIVARLVNEDRRKITLHCRFRFEAMWLEYEGDHRFDRILNVVQEVVTDDMAKTFDSDFRVEERPQKGSVCINDEGVVRVVYVVEALAVIRGCRLAQRLQFLLVEVASDCQELIRALQNHTVLRSVIGDVLHDIWDLLIFFNDVAVTHVKRAGNKLAYAMARLAQSVDSCRVWMKEVPVSRLKVDKAQDEKRDAKGVQVMDVQSREAALLKFDVPRYVDGIHMPGLRCVTLFFLILPLELDCPIWVNRKIIQLLTPNYGYLVGNPVTDGQFDNGAVVPYFHGMGLISDELHKVIQQRDDAEGNMQVL